MEPCSIEAVIRYLTGVNSPPDNGRKWVRMLCPFHPDSIQSAAVSYTHNAFNCLGCGVKGGPYKLLMTEKGVSFAEAKRIAERLSEGGHSAVPHPVAGKSRRRVFGEQGTCVTQDQGQDGEVLFGIRGRSASWS